MTLFEMSPEKYLEKYVYGKRERISRNMSYGSQMAKGLEAEEATGDPLLDLVMARLPKFELMDKPIEAILPVRGGLTACINAAESETTSGKEPEVIHLLAKPDTAKADYTAFKEYKTSVRKWTQKMADDSGQITFYATTIWLAKGFIPQDIELVDAVVEYDPDGRLRPTGDIWRFQTKRTMVDIIKMTGRMKKAWAGIKELCKNELL